MRKILKQIPVAGPAARSVYRRVQTRRRRREALRAFAGSVNYWEARYTEGGTSGSGSYDKFAEFKAETLNHFVADNRISSVIEFGCGDGSQLSHFAFPKYLGLDVSPTAVELCRARFKDDPTKDFALVDQWDGATADCALSLDVVYHLVEDATYETYMARLFDGAERFVVVYSSDRDEPNQTDPHVRHRQFSDWIEANRPNWQRINTVPNRYPYAGDYTTGSFADFHFFAKIPNS